MRPVPAFRTDAENQKTIVVAVSSSYQEVSLVHTGVLNALVEQGWRLVLVTPNQTIALRLRALFHEQGVVFWIHEKSKPSLLERVIKTMQVRQQAHRFPPLKRQAWLRRQAERRRRTPWRVPYDHATELIASAVDEQHVSRAEMALIRDSSLDRLFKKYRPKLALLAWAGAYPPCPSVARAAAQYGCKTLSLDASWDNMDELSLVPRLDRIVVWNEWMKSEATEVRGYAEEAVTVLGPVRCDYYHEARWLLSREEAFGLAGLDPTRRLITIAINRGEAESYRKTVRALLMADDEGAFNAPIQILVRLAPRSIDEDYAEFASEARVLTSRAFDFHGEHPLSKQDIQRSVSLIAHTDVMVSVLSTLILESVISDTPNITLEYEEFAGLYNRDFIQPLLGHEGLAQALTPADVVRWTVQYLMQPALHRDARAALSREFGGSEAGCKERLLNEVETMTGL